jgi:chemotaxis protein MotB
MCARLSKSWKRLAVAEALPQPLLPAVNSSFANPMDKARPIIIVKKKGGHGGHHGGAWKVAYADFVTAMMSLFMVMWLMSSSKPVKEAISGYFKDPAGTASKMGSALSGVGENFTLTKDNMPKLKDQLEQKIRQMNDFDKLKSHVEMTVTSEGLRIELTESATGTFFDSGSAKLNGDGRELLITLAQELGKLPNKLSIEGHTDSKPYAGSANYSNWELSTDRANSARRLMQGNGIGPDQITQVRGFADQRLRKADNPLDPANRRISIIVQYIEKKGDEEEAKEGSAEGEKPSAGVGEKKGKAGNSEGAATPAESSGKKE